MGTPAGVIFKGAKPGDLSVEQPTKREIKALSPQEISDYLSGKGMGLAKAAELNGYPGPAHVLELATQLHLQADQKVKTEALFKRMQGRAIALGKELVEEESALNHIFASHSVTPEALGGSLARIAKLQAQVRQVHLEASPADSFAEPRTGKSIQPASGLWSDTRG